MRHRPARTAQGRTRREDGEEDGGYIMAAMGLLLVPLLLFTAFAVDVGGWYARGAKLQRVADAAALAGAARMPDFPAARTLAETTARLNGIVDSATIDIIVTQGANDRQIKVTITDRNVDQFLSSLVLDNVTINRSAIAEFVLPVPLGSPENYFGNDPINPPAVQPGLWGNIHGPQTDNQKGDRYAAGCRGTTGCTAKTTEYTGSYIYAIDVPPGGTSNMQVQIYDAGMYNRATEQTETGDRAYSLTGQTTTWEMFYTDDTPLDASDNISNHSMATGPSAERCQGTTTGQFTIAQEASASTYRNRWATICQRTSAVEGRYYLRVSTTGNGDFANRYSVRVLPSAAGPARPRLSAYNNMSMFNNSLLTSPSFHLAQVLPIHQGKALIVNLYDPGEIGVANARMLIQRPNATGTGVTTAPRCRVSVFTNPTDTTPASVTTRVPCSIPTTNGSGGAYHDGDLLKIEIVLGVPDLGVTYTCATCWWKVRYDLGTNPSGSPADTTTWSAAIKGDPVHLINE